MRLMWVELVAIALAVGCVRAGYEAQRHRAALDAAAPETDGGRPHDEDSGRGRREQDSGIPQGDEDSGRGWREQDSGVPQGDRDSGAIDSTPVDACPSDPNKTAPGICGCGYSEHCAGLIGALVHRYRFEGRGTTLADSAGGAPGTSVTSLTGSGSLALSGSNASFATLPSGLVSASTAATIEFWLTWQGGAPHQRVLAFGTATPHKPSVCAGLAEFFSGSWYHFCQRDGTMAWSRARTICEGAGGHLVSIDSSAEDRYVDSHPSFTESVWIGANDLETEGQWYFANQAGLSGGAHVWSGDETGRAVGGAFTDWTTAPPNPADDDPNLDCSFIYKATTSWSAYGCEFDGDFVCEWRGHQGPALNRGVAFTPSDADDLPSLTFKAGSIAIHARASSAFPTAAPTHVALVLDPAGSGVSLYIAGVLAASAAASDALANLRDVDNWLGRSHVADDPALTGSLSELRIYDRALTAQELMTSFTAGPDPTFLPP